MVNRSSIYCEKNTAVPLGILYFKLHMLCAVPPCFSVKLPLTFH